MWLGYLRVSRVGDRGDRLISPEMQAERIRSYAGGRGLEVELLAPELDVSGGQVERPVLDEALERIADGEAQGIIVAQLDRLSRAGIVDTHKLIERVGPERVISVAESFDASTPEGRMGRNVMLALGELQLDRYKSQFSEAKRQAVDRGIWPVPRVPIGYERGPDRRLLPSSDAPRVARAFGMRAAGAGWKDVGREIGRGYTGAKKAIENRVYLGEIRVGEFVNPAAHEPIVSRELWEAAQIRHPSPAKGVHGPALLQGIVRCAGCQRMMSPDQASGGGAYRCRRHFAAGSCESPAWISASKLDPYVERAFLDHLAVSFESGPRTDRLEEASRKLAAAEAELAAYQEATRISEVGAEHFAAGMQRRVEDVESARREVARMRSAESALSEIGTVAERWPELGVAERGHVLRGALGVVWVRSGRSLAIGERVKIVAAGFEPSGLSRGGIGGSPPIRPLVWEDVVGEIRPVVAE